MGRREAATSSIFPRNAGIRPDESVTLEAMHWIKPRGFQPPLPGEREARAVDDNDPRVRVTRVVAFLIAALVAALGFALLVLGSCFFLFEPSWVSVVNQSRATLENIVVITEPDQHQCDSLPVGDAFTVTVKPVDSKYVDVSFTCAGVMYTYPDCGTIDAFGQQRTVIVLNSGESIDIDFGTGLLTQRSHRTPQ